MLFELNKNKFMVRFSRSGTTTYAELWQYKDDLYGWDCLNILGVAKCNPKDRFEKSKGRKIALKNLLYTMNTFDRVADLSNTREDRTKIWEIYFKEHRK